MSPAMSSGDVRRGSLKVANASANDPLKSSTGSNANNSKPMTARDRKRRQMHNASATRSRIRLNETLDKMWRTIPITRRRKRIPPPKESGNKIVEVTSGEEEDGEERIGRADKVEVGIDYILYLEERIKKLEAQAGQSG